MPRGKVQLKRIENPVRRQVTFCKRRMGLLKKAKELSILCDADVGIIIFSTHGKLYELSTKGSMQGLIERYANKSSQGSAQAEGCQPHEESKEEASKVKQEMQLLQKGLRELLGGEVGKMSLDELLALERLLEFWIYHVRSAKTQTTFQEIQLLKNKEEILKAANGFLLGKIEEQNKIFDVPPILTEIPYPLTIQNEIFQF